MAAKSIARLAFEAGLMAPRQLDITRMPEVECGSCGGEGIWDAMTTDVDGETIGVQHCAHCDGTGWVPNPEYRGAR